MFLIIGPAQAGSELHIIEDVVIGLPERSIGIQHIGILAEEIVVPLVVQMLQIVRVDILALHLPFHAYLCVLERIRIPKTAYETVRIVGDTGIPRQRLGWAATSPGIARQSQRIDKDVVILLCLVMKVIAADAEIERAIEMRFQTEFLA